MKQLSIVRTEDAPAAIGPYSQAVVHGGLVFTAGQIPLDPATGEEVISLMFDLNREQRTTLVLVTHDLALSNRCGRQLRLRGGQLVETEGAAA